MRHETSIFSYIGGKYYLLKHLLPFPIHQIYVEVFGGSAVTLLNKVPTRSETYNDTNSRFVNFWNVLKDYQMFLRLFIDGTLDARVTFNALLKGDPIGSAVPISIKAFENATLVRTLKDRNDDADIAKIVTGWESSDVETRVLDAFTYYYLIHHSFSFKGNAYNGMSMNWKDARNKIRESFVQKTREDAFFQELFKVYKTVLDGTYDGNLDDAFAYFDLDGKDDVAKISWTWNRIKNVRFDCQDFRKIIPRFDKKGVLMYLDPPWFQSPDFVSNSFPIDDHADLLALLKDLKEAMFVLSIDNRDFYYDPLWYYQEVTRNNCAGSKGKKRGTITEYIIRNFDPATTPVQGTAGEKTILDFVQQSV